MTMIGVTPKQFLERIEELKKENKVLRESFNELARDLGNGEHVEFSWIKDAFDSATHSHLARALRNKLNITEEENKQLRNHLCGLASEVLTITTKANESPHVQYALKINSTNDSSSSTTSEG